MIDLSKLKEGMKIKRIIDVPNFTLDKSYYIFREKENSSGNLKWLVYDDVFKKQEIIAENWVIDSKEIPKEITQLEEVNKNAIEKIKKLKIINESNRKEIKQLKNAVEKLQTENEKLSDENRILSKKLKEDVDNLLMENTNLYKKNHQLSKQDKDKKNQIIRLKDLKKIQSDSLIDKYMVGFFNGIELSIAIIEDRSPNYKEIPDIEKVIKEESPMEKFCLQLKEDEGYLLTWHSNIACWIIDNLNFNHSFSNKMAHNFIKYFFDADYDIEKFLGIGQDE